MYNKGVKRVQMKINFDENTNRRLFFVSPFSGQRQAIVEYDPQKNSVKVKDVPIKGDAIQVKSSIYIYSQLSYRDEWL